MKSWLDALKERVTKLAGSARRRVRYTSYPSEERQRSWQFGHALKVRAILGLFHLLRRTWRLEEAPFPEGIRERLESGLPVVFAHFHEDEWAMLAFYVHRQMNVMVSLSQDGGLMSAFLTRLGFHVVRGSSSKGGAAGLLQLIRGVKANDRKGVSLAVDGPRGPRRRVKKGVFKLAESLEAPIVCGGAVASNPVIFRKSWSKAFVPKPFSRVYLIYAPIMSVQEVKRGVERDDYATLSFALEERLKGAKSMAYDVLRSGGKAT